MENDSRCSDVATTVCSPVSDSAAGGQSETLGVFQDSKCSVEEPKAIQKKRKNCVVEQFKLPDNSPSTAQALQPSTATVTAQISSVEKTQPSSTNKVHCPTEEEEEKQHKKPLTCSSHNGDDFVLFCSDCIRPVCVKCIPESRSRHDLKNLKDQYFKAMENIAEAKDDTRQKKEYLKAGIERERNNKAHFERSKIASLSNMVKLENQCSEKLHWKFEEMSQQVVNIFADKMNPLLENIELMTQGVLMCEAAEKVCESEQHNCLYVILNEDAIIQKLANTALYVRKNFENVQWNNPDGDDVEVQNVCTNMVNYAIDQVHFTTGDNKETQNQFQMPIKDKEDACIQCDIDVKKIMSVLAEERDRAKKLEELMQEEIDELKATVRDLKQQEEERCGFLTDSARSFMAVAGQPTDSAFSSVENLSQHRAETVSRFQLDVDFAKTATEGSHDVFSSQSSSYLEVKGHADAD